MTGTQISDMTISATIPEGGYVPFVITSAEPGFSLTSNYIYDLGTDLLTRVSYTALALPTAAALVGSTGPSNVQADINARPTLATLAANGGSELVGFSQAETYSEETIGQRLKQEIWVTDAPYNADPTGVADASAAIQDAIDDAFANGIGTVRLSGLFRIDSTLTLPSGVSLQGSGANYRFDMVNIFDGTWLQYRGTATNPAVRFGSVQSCGLSRLGIDCNEAAGTRAISIGSDNNPATKNLVFEGLQIFGAETGVQWGDSSVTPLEQCDEISFRDTQFHSCVDGFVIDAANAADFSIIERISFSQLQGVAFKMLTPGFMRISQCAAGLLLSTSKMFEISGSSPDPLIIEGCQSEGPDGKWLTYTAVNDQGTIILNGNVINQPVEIDGITRVISRGNFVNSTLTMTGFVRWKSDDDVFNGVFGQPTYAQQVFVDVSVQFSGYSLKNATQQRGFYLPNNYHVENGTATAGGYTGLVNTRDGIYAYGYVELSGAGFPVGFTVVPTVDNGHAYVVTANVGPIGAEPAWPTGSGATVTSGGVTFEEIGTAALMKGYGAIQA